MKLDLEARYQEVEPSQPLELDAFTQAIHAFTKDTGKTPSEIIVSPEQRVELQKHIDSIGYRPMGAQHLTVFGIKVISDPTLKSGEIRMIDP